MKKLMLVLMMVAMLAVSANATLVLRDFQDGTAGGSVPNAGAGSKVTLTTLAEGGSNLVARWQFNDDQGSYSNPWWWGENAFFNTDSVDGSGYDTLEFKFKANVSPGNLGVRVLNNGAWTMNYYGGLTGFPVTANTWTTIQIDISGIADTSKNDIDRIEFFSHWGWQQGQMDWRIDDIQLVPEPATMALLGLGSLVLIRRKKA